MVRPSAAILVAGLLLGLTAAFVLKAADPADGEEEHRACRVAARCQLRRPMTTSRREKIRPIRPRSSVAWCPTSDVWIDAKNKQVVIDGQVCLTRGPLEMFAVPKEYERARIGGCRQHQSLCRPRRTVGRGSEPWQHGKVRAEIHTGHRPENRDSRVLDRRKRQPEKSPRQDWVRDVKTKKAMEYPWVFAGSGFYQRRPDRARNITWPRREILFAFRIFPMPCSTCRSKAPRTMRICCSRRLPKIFRRWHKGDTGADAADRIKNPPAPKAKSRNRK